MAFVSVLRARHRPGDAGVARPRSFLVPPALRLDRSLSHQDPGGAPMCFCARWPRARRWDAPCTTMLGTWGLVPVLLARRGFLREAAFDHLERQKVLALLAKHPPEPLHVLLVELPVPRRRPLGVHEPLALQEADLRDGHVREFPTQEGEHVPYRQVGPPAHIRPLPRTSAAPVPLGGPFTGRPLTRARLLTSAWTSRMCPPVRSPSDLSLVCCCQVDQLELTDLNLVAGGENELLDTLAVDVGAVQ